MIKELTLELQIRYKGGEQTLAIRIKTTKRGLPSSSILGIGGGWRLWNWRSCIPFLPFAWTTSAWPWLCLQAFWVVFEDTSECLTKPSSWVLEFDNGSRTTAFKDRPTSIFTSMFLPFWVSVFSTRTRELAGNNVRVTLLNLIHRSRLLLTVPLPPYTWHLRMHGIGNTWTHVWSCWWLCDLGHLFCHEWCFFFFLPKFFFDKFFCQSYSLVL